jgi:putative chitinase
MITLQQFATSVGCTLMTAEAWHEPFEVAMVERAINTPKRIAAFLAQCGHESRSLSALVENLNYSAQRLREVWPSRFPTIEKAHFYEHQPERLANEVYGSRMGNGPYESGDGFRYRGRGVLMITGANNYRRCGAALNLPLIEDPDLLLVRKHAARAAAWFWGERGCNVPADAGDIETVTKKINGGLVGLSDRVQRTKTALKAIA